MKMLWIVWSNSIVELAQFHRRSPVTLLQRNKQLACNPFYKMCHQQISCWSKIAWLFPLGEGRIRYITFITFIHTVIRRGIEDDFVACERNRDFPLGLVYGDRYASHHVCSLDGGDQNQIWGGKTLETIIWLLQLDSKAKFGFENTFRDLSRV